jgi:hypothetical protein
MRLNSRVLKLQREPAQHTAYNYCWWQQKNTLGAARVGGSVHRAARAVRNSCMHVSNVHAQRLLTACTTQSSTLYVPVHAASRLDAACQSTACSLNVAVRHILLRFIQHLSWRVIG